MPLTDSEVMDYALRFYLSVGSDTVILNQKHRDRARFLLQELSDDTLGEAPFWFRLGSSTVTTSPGVGTASVPPDLGYFSDQTHIYLAGRQLPLRYADMDIITGYRETNPRTAIPELYCLFGTSTTNIPTLQFYPTPNQAYTLDVGPYVKRYPDIVDRPGPFSAAANGAGVLTGNYLWKVTYVTALGECEAGIASPVTGAITLASNAALLSGIPVSMVHRVTSRKVYRTAAGGSVFKLAGTIADNVTTTFSDNLADGSLGATAPDVTTAVTGMVTYPEDFHITVFVRGLCNALAVSQGDSRTQQWRGDWLRAVKKRWAEHRQGQNFPQVLPPYGSMSGPVRAASWRYRIS